MHPIVQSRLLSLVVYPVEVQNPPQCYCTLLDIFIPDTDRRIIALHCAIYPGTFSLGARSLGFTMSRMLTNMLGLRKPRCMASSRPLKVSRTKFDELGVRLNARLSGPAYCCAHLVFFFFCPYNLLNPLNCLLCHSSTPSVYLQLSFPSCRAAGLQNTIQLFCSPLLSSQK